MCISNHTQSTSIIDVIIKIGEIAVAATLPKRSTTSIYPIAMGRKHAQQPAAMA